MKFQTVSGISLILFLYLLLLGAQAYPALSDDGSAGPGEPTPQPDPTNVTDTVPKQEPVEPQNQLQPGETAAHAAPVALSATSSFTIGQNFTGSNYSNSGYIPPDTMGAVGPNHIVEILNGRYAVYDKVGTFSQGSTLDQFWLSAGVTPAGSFSFDPRIIYDKYSGRWFVASVDNAGGANNFLVAVSSSSDPTAGWTGFAIDTDSDDTHWADFPTLGLNQDVVVLTANMFAIVSGSSAQTTLVLPKSDLTAVVPTVANATIFEETNPNNTGFSAQPVYDQDDGNLPLPLLSAYNKPAGFLKTSSVGGTAITPTLNTAGGFIGVTARNLPPDIDQPGAKVDIDTGDNRFSGNAIMQQIPGRSNPSIWGVQSVDIGGRAAIEWNEIDAATNAILQNGVISDTSLAFNYPSIAVNDFGDVVIGFSGGDPSTFMSTYVVVGGTNGGVTTLTAPQQTKAGVADYQRLDGIGRNRWGDYSATVVDPSNENHFWTFQEFVSATDQWAIQITEIIIAPSISVSQTADPAALPEPGGSVTFTVNVSNTGPVSVTLNNLTDDVYGNLDGQGDCTLPQIVNASNAYGCTFTAVVSGNAGDTITNTVTASGIGQAISTTDSDSAAVTITDVLPAINVSKTPNLTGVPEPGGTVTFTVQVTNTGTAESVTLTGLTDDIHGNLNGQGTCSITQMIAAGGTYECSFSAAVSGNPGDSETDTVTATAEDDELNATNVQDSATVTITDVLPTINVSKTVTPTSLLEPGGIVTFTVRVTNTSTVELVTLTDLDDDIHGDLDGQDSCSLPQAMAATSFYECSFTAMISGNAGYTETDTITAMAEDDELNVVSAQDSATVNIAPYPLFLPIIMKNP